MKDLNFFRRLSHIQHLKYIHNFLLKCMSGVSVHPARIMSGITDEYHYFLLDNYDEYRRAHDLFKKANKGFYTNNQNKSRKVKNKISR